MKSLEPAIRAPGASQPYATFDVATVARPEQRLAAWSDAICEHYYPLDLRLDADVLNTGRLVIADIGELRVGTLDCEALSIVRTPTHIKCDNVEHFMLPLSAGPELAVEQRGNQGRLSVGDLAFVTTGESYTYRQATQGRTTAMRLPAHLVRERMPGADDLCGVRFDGQHAMVAIFIDFAKSCIRHGGSLEEEKAGVMRCFLDLFALTISAPQSAFMSEETSVKLAHRRRALRYIDANLHRFDLHSVTVSTAVGISSRYLQKIFAEKGQRVSSIIHDRRMAEAKRLLENPQGAGTIAQVAFAVGCGDLSYFCRAFKSATGQTPSEYRASARSSTSG